jgi:hypothetical protein
MKRLQILKVPAILMTCAVLALGIAGPAWSTNKVSLSPYAPFPRTALTAVGVSFARPTHAQIIGVRVSVSKAYDVGLTQVGELPKGATVTLRLGLFSDTVQNFARNVVLAYAVIFDGVIVPSYGPKPGAAGHELVVIVNATTGRTVESFSYR